MRVTRLGHAALSIETDGEHLLVDPGTFTDDWHRLSDLTVILITHQHADHVDVANVAGLVARNPGVRVLAEESVVPTLAGVGVEARPARPGEVLALGTTELEVVGGFHAIIHGSLPRVGNVGFVIAPKGGPRLYHPGDSYEYPLKGIDVLALPITAPWTRVAHTADYLAAVRPARAFPIHDAIISPTGFDLYMRLAGELGGDGVDLVPLGAASSLEL